MSVLEGMESKPLQLTKTPPLPVAQQYGNPQVSFLAHNPQDFVFKEPNIVNRPQDVYNSRNGMIRTSNPMPLNIDPFHQPEQLAKVRDPVF